MDTQPGTQNPEPGTENQKTEPAKTEVVREIHHHHDHSRSPGGMFFGILIVAIGVYFLGKQAGWFPADVDLNWNLIWPLFIIAFGVSLLSRRGTFGWLVTTILTIAVLGFLAAMAFGWMGTSPALTTDVIGIAKEANVTSAVFTVGTGAGKLTMTGGASQLVSGTYTHTGMTLEKSSSVAGNVQDVTLKTTGSWAWFGMHRNDLTLRVASDVPTTLNVNSGASDMDLNFADVMLQAVDIDTGASSLVLNLGDKVDQSSVKVKAGASSVTVSLPKTVGVKVTLDAGATSKNLTDFHKLDDKTYESTNYSSTTKKVHLDFDLGAASLTVLWR